MFQVSARRGCKVLCLQESTYFYTARRPSQAALKTRIPEIAETRARYGYRRIHILLRREGLLSANVPFACRATGR